MLREKDVLTSSFITMFLKSIFLVFLVKVSSTINFSLESLVYIKGNMLSQQLCTRPVLARTG